MKDLEVFKNALDKMGVIYLEETRDTHTTYIVMVGENERGRKIDIFRDRFWEFENGELASYP